MYGLLNTTPLNTVTMNVGELSLLIVSPCRSEPPHFSEETVKKNIYTVQMCRGVYSRQTHRVGFLKVSAVSFGRLGLIKRLTLERYGVFKGDLSVPALTPQG